MFIKEVHIYNFRSFVKAEVPLNNISVFVGFNDVGKSNVLKALNLFFNNETDYEKPLNFEEDYCKYSPARKKKAKEIIIELILKAPSNYKGAKDIKWTKFWRGSGFVNQKIAFADGSNFPPKSKLYSWLENIRFTYVPAIRGNSYFQILLANLHDMLDETFEEELRQAGDEFVGKLKSNTQGMIAEIFNRIGIKSQIRFPSNLRSLFRTLDFSTTDGMFNISLSNRGDGVKTRHIPAILKFISDQLNVNKVKGAPNINMVWGYEEPENNLEMMAAYDLASQFVEYSNGIQILLTTHSPAFYSLKEKQGDNLNLIKVVKENGSEAQLIQVESPSNLDVDMGVMPIVAPYINQKVKEIEELQEKYDKELSGLNKNVLFVEGEDEVRVFSKIISDEGLEDKIAVSCDGLGCSGVKNKLMAYSWASGTSKFRAAGIFDNDIPGGNEYGKLIDEKKFKDSERKKRVKAFIYKPPLHLINIKKQIHNFPIEIEEMYPVQVWETARQNGWLVERNVSELASFVTPDTPEQTIREKIEALNLEEREKLYVFFKVPDNHKSKCSNLVIHSPKETAADDMLFPLKDFFSNHIALFLASE